MPIKNTFLASNSQELLFAIANNSSTVVFVKDTEGRFLFINRQFEQLFNISNEQIRGKTDCEIFGAEIADVVQQNDRKVIQAGVAMNIEETIPHPDGLHTYISTKFPIRDRDGHIFALGGIATDVTHRKVMESQLLETSTFLDSIIEDIPDMIFIKEAENLTFVRLNRAAETLLGLKRSELLGRNDYDFFPKPQADFFTRKDREVLEHVKFLDIPEEKIATKSSGERILHTKKVALAGTDGKPRYLLGISQDITERVQTRNELLQLQDHLELLVEERTEELKREVHARQEAERQLRLYTAELEAANAELNNFARMASHDLTAPLRAIENLTSWIENDSGQYLPEASQNHLQKIKQRATRMSRLLEDLLEYSRAGGWTGQPEVVDTRQLVTDIVDLLEPPAQMKITIDCALSPIQTFRVPFEQSLRKLIQNAITHHNRPNGAIHLRAREIGDAVEIVVEDDGPGIPAEQHTRIFEVFTKLQSTTNVGGSGVGLPIVKKNVDRVGGRVWVESEVDQGSRFHLIWPITKDAALKN